MDVNYPSVRFMVTFATLSLTVIYFAFDYIVHSQYGFTNDFTFTYFIQKYPLIAVALWYFTWQTYIRSNNYFIQLLHLVASGISSCYLIQLTSSHSTFGDMLKTPGLVTIWVYTVSQMWLSLSVVSLFVPFLYYNREWFLSSNMSFLE